MKTLRAPHLNRILALLVLCAGGSAARPAAAALTDPAQIQTEAYVNLVQADQSLDAGRLDEALAQYQAARDYYLQLAKDFPGWEPRVIQYRKTYCDNQIADVERRKSGQQPEELPELEPLPSEPPTPETTPAPTPAPAPAATPAPDAPPPAARAVEVDYLKSRIASLESEVADLSSLQEESDALLAQNDQLRKDLDAANQSLAQRPEIDPAALDALRADVKAKEEQIQSLQAQLDAKKPLDQALNDVEAQAHELRAQNDRLNQEIKTLDQELDDAETRAEQAEQQAQQSKSAQADAEQKLQKALDAQSDAERRIASLQQQPAPAQSPAAQKAPEPPAAKKTEKKSEKKAEAPAVKPAPAPDAPERVLATVPPKDIPRGMSAADFVRQLLQDGENDAALSTVQDARKAAPADMNLALIEGIALIRLQRYSESAALLIDLAKSNPRNPEVHATLGAAMMGAGFHDEARETLQMALKLDKNLPECLYNLAQLYTFVDPIDLKTARKYYQQARDLGLAADPQLDKALK